MTTIIVEVFNRAEEAKVLRTANHLGQKINLQNQTYQILTGLNFLQALHSTYSSPSKQHTSRKRYGGSQKHQIIFWHETSCRQPP